MFWLPAGFITPQPALAQIDPAPAALPPAPDQLGLAPLSGNETQPEIKQLASAIALGLADYNPDEDLGAIAARLSPLVGAQAGDLASTLHHPGAWSRGRVVYPQLGGLLPDSASVMVVLEQLIGMPDAVHIEIRTLDIRVRRTAAGWQFAGLASAGGDPVAPPRELSPEALAVLTDRRIELPDSARWDIFAGRISTNLLRVMARMAEVTPYGVVTLSSGHPWEIFGTDRQSDHTRGRAVDIYRLGTTLIIDDRARGSATYEVVNWLYAQPEVSRIGSPWALDGFGGRSFTDALHLDHLHVAVHPD